MNMGYLWLCTCSIACLFFFMIFGYRCSRVFYCLFFVFSSILQARGFIGAVFFFLSFFCRVCLFPITYPSYCLYTIIIIVIISIILLYLL
ncbi:hypothetical protein K440DRAFT_130080 [Wilcoxina mikolae CBS 423.85]|nr:hypothetical protein K440DRAFT_130080 [Wilcoxina mikolae CBS 423.85]